MNAVSKQPLPSKTKIADALRGEPLAQYRTKARLQSLSRRERIVMLDALERVFGGIYAHLPLKHARYGFDPVQRLRILRTQVEELPDLAFNAEIGDIFARLRDAHTWYQRPGAKNKVAVLPFILEMFGGTKNPRYLVSKIGPGVDQPKFVSGVEVETWNEVPIDRVVQRHGEAEAGGRADSMRSWAIATLTNRALEYYDMPDEDRVVIGFRAVDADGEPTGKRQSATFDWSVLDTSVVEEFQSEQPDRPAARARMKALNPAAAAVKRAKLLVFASNALRGEAAPRPAISKETVPKGAVAPLKTSLAEYLKGGTIQGSKPGETFGYLRLFTFDVRSVREFLEEVRRLLLQMPPRGLIVDIRDNPGGVVVAAEMALQFLTPRTIEPVRFSLRATDFARNFCDQEVNLEEYAKVRPSLAAAIRNGELYSAALPITEPSRCNLAGQIYGGPVVLITSATTYSSGDLFTAGFVDNGIGKVVCVGQSTGAGGACVSNYDAIRDAFGSGRQKLAELPGGAGLTISLMRATRSGPNQGAPIEDVGVTPDVAYESTRADLLDENRDLLATCVGLLEEAPYTVMKCKVSKGRDGVEVTTQGLDQLDVRLDSRSLASATLKEGATYKIAIPARTRRVELCGFREGELKQRRVIDESIVLPDE